MRSAEPSLTAMRVATWRAAHQLFDSPKLVDDPLAVRIIGRDEEEQLRQKPWMHGSGVSRTGRAIIVARSRLAEEELALAVERGATQYVLLGAGLDTYAHRNPYGSKLRIFEVDHPATQAWKRARLWDDGVGVPP